MSLTPEDKQWISQNLSEQLEKVETKLLTAFHRWAEPLTAYVRSHSADIRALQIAMESLQDRLDKLEGNQH